MLNDRAVAALAEILWTQPPTLISGQACSSGASRTKINTNSQLFRVLRLGNNSLNANALSALFTPPNVVGAYFGLRALYLDRNPIDITMLILLLDFARKSSDLSILETLSLRKCNLTPKLILDCQATCSGVYFGEGATSTCDRRNLNRLILSENNLGTGNVLDGMQNSGARAVSFVLHAIPSIVHLELEDCTFGDNNIEHLVNLLRQESSNGDGHLEHNHRMSRSAGLQSLDLRHNQLSGQCIDHLSKLCIATQPAGLCTSKTRSPDSTQASISAGGDVERLSPSLTFLDIRRNRIGMVGVSKLASCIQRSNVGMGVKPSVKNRMCTLEAIALGRNLIGTAGFVTLMEALTGNRTVHTVQISKQDLGDSPEDEEVMHELATSFTRGVFRVQLLPMPQKLAFLSIFEGDDPPHRRLPPEVIKTIFGYLRTHVRRRLVLTGTDSLVFNAH